MVKVAASFQTCQIKEQGGWVLAEFFPTEVGVIVESIQSKWAIKKTRHTHPAVCRSFFVWYHVSLFLIMKSPSHFSMESPSNSWIQPVDGKKTSCFFLVLWLKQTTKIKSFDTRSGWFFKIDLFVFFVEISWTSLWYDFVACFSEDELYTN